MNVKLDDKEVAVLDIIYSSNKPMGSWFLVEKLEERGIHISSATTGRILVKLENLGYLVKNGVKGRVITKEGIKALQDAKTNKKLDYYRDKMDRLIRTEVLENYLMALQARKAIERETARLAAKNITKEELENLKLILKTQEEKKANNESIAEVDINFHKAIAKASGNPILEALYAIVATYGQQSQLFEYIRSQVSSSYSTHGQIYEAIKSRDMDLAEKYMVQHIENLSMDVINFWNKFKELKGKNESEDVDNDK